MEVVKGVTQSPVSLETICVRLDEEIFDDLRARLDSTRLIPFGENGWKGGTPQDWLLKLVEDWREFDVKSFNSRLARLRHLRAVVGGQAIHFVLEEGNGPDPFPLVMTHGWPSSFCEYLEILPLLADPGAHGGDPQDAFTVVVPSLPGFGFSDPPPSGGLTADVVAELWHRVLSEGLGFARYAAHGSDLGAGVTARLARAHPDSVVGIHLATPGLPPPPKPWASAEEAHFAEVDAWTAEEGGYGHMQSTKPATLASALSDSPVGLGAWIGEKVMAWSSTRSDGEPAFGRDLLLATLTIYWVTGTIGSSFLPYWVYRHNPASGLRAGEPIPTPTAVSIFGGEQVPFPKPPRELAERYFNVTNWDEYDCGGHFPAVAEAMLLAELLRGVFRPLR
jgi:pimeloyl-ACP methyl ester carboxylesterase